MLRRLKLIGAIVLVGIALGVSGPIGCTPATSSGCCRYCTRGKPCGDTCIAAHLNCDRGPGCACYAR